MGYEYRAGFDASPNGGPAERLGNSRAGGGPPSVSSLGATRVLLIVVFIVVGIPALVYLLWLVHCGLDRVCVRHARRFCSRSGLEIRRVRWHPQSESSGIKTEFTLVQLDCFDAQKQRRLVLLFLWSVRRHGTDQGIHNCMHNA